METELERLKRENYRKQMLATRLLLQRNNKDFFISKIKFALAQSLEKVGGRPNHNFNIFEAINILTERAAARWEKYEKALLNSKELLKKNNLLNEEIHYFDHEADISISSDQTERSEHFIPPRSLDEWGKSAVMYHEEKVDESAKAATDYYFDTISGKKIKAKKPLPTDDYPHN